MPSFVHPATADITLEGVLGALADPMRRRILKKMMDECEGVSCCRAAPCPHMSKSTLSYHFRILREAGLIRTCKRGTENHNTPRKDDIDSRFPGLLALVLKLDEGCRERD